MARLPFVDETPGKSVQGQTSNYIGTSGPRREELYQNMLSRDVQVSETAFRHRHCEERRNEALSQQFQAASRHVSPAAGLTRTKPAAGEPIGFGDSGTNDGQCSFASVEIVGEIVVPPQLKWSV